MPHFLTCRVTKWLPVFTSEPYLRIVANSLAYCRERKGLLLHAYVVMPTHVHLIVSAVEGRELSDILRDFRRHTSKAISAQLAADDNRLFLYVLEKAAEKQKRDDLARKVWADGMHPETLISDKFYQQKLTYLHDNPVRKGLVAKPEYWLYSSASAYIGGEVGPVDLDLLY